MAVQQVDEEGIILRVPPLILPREHGAWAVLLVPFAVGALVGGRWNEDLLLVAAASLCVFVGAAPLEVLLRNLSGQPQPAKRLRQARFWAPMLLGAGAISGLVLMLKRPEYALLAAIGGVALAGSFVTTMKRPKTLGGDLLALTGLTLTGPAASLAARGTWGRTTLLIWLLSALYFVWTVFYVHMKIRATASKMESFSAYEKIRLGRWNLLSLACSVTAASAIEKTLLVPFGPMLIHGLLGTVLLSGNVRFKSLGFVLLAESILFGVLLILCL